MRRRTAVMAAVAAGAVGTVLLAPPVLAATTRGGSGTGYGPGTCAGTGRDADDGTSRGGPMGMGRGAGNDLGQGYGMGARAGGAGPATGLPAVGTLTSAQKTDLAGMAEEEKLAHDVYSVLAQSTGDQRFGMIAASEQRHLDAVRVVLARYSVADPTAGKAAGEFTSPTSTRAYATYVAKGKASDAAALEVGRTIESTDIADLKAASPGASAPDVTELYSRLGIASSHHLAAFTR